MGHVDPRKEVEAAALRIANNISTQEQEASEYNGNDWAANIRQRKREIEAMQEMGLGQAQSETITKDEEDEEDA